jgi:nondiscriminating aspartyl-tRNA synthetase
MLNDRILAATLRNYVGKTVLLRGWLHTIRAFGGLLFLILRDRSGLAQIVVTDRDQNKKILQLQSGSILRIEGRVVTSREQHVGVEVVDPILIVEHPIDLAPPFAYYLPKLNADLDYLLDHRPLTLRNRQQQAIFRIQAEIAHAYRLFMHDQINAVEYFPPNVIGASSEGGAEFFSVDYFGYPATLAQSSQLYKQIMVGVNERVFAITPFFRAEPSHTTRHLSEGKQFEFEMGFFTHWHEILDILERCIKFVVSFLCQHAKEDLEVLEGSMIRCPADVSFPRLSFRDAQELYFQRTGVDERHEPDLSPAAERDLCAWALEEHGTDCLFVTDWKTEKRPFYAYPNDEDPSVTNTFDLLCAGVEITSGGQRRHTYASMLEGLLLKQMHPEHFSDYLSIFQYGMPPHGGFGMGLERLTMTLLKLKNIREASLFPSDTKRIASNRIKAHIFFGGQTVRNEIIRRLRVHKFIFTHRGHAAEPSPYGLKCLILRGKNSKKNVQFNIPIQGKLDMKACAELVGERCEFEDPAIILERFGIEVGGVSPFGNLLNLDNYFDERILGQERVIFSCGIPAESIEMETQDLIALVEPKWGRFFKE